MGKSDPAPGKQTKTKFIRRTAIRLVTVLIALAFALALGEVVVRILTPQNLSGTWRRTDPNGVFVHNKNHSARHQLGNRIVNYRFNEFGLRDLGQGDGDTRVLCLGDSFTFGWLLQDQDTFVSRLQQKADMTFGEGRVALLNGGHGGWGTTDYVRFFEEYGGSLRLDGVIVFLNTDDIGRSLKNPKYEFTEEGELIPISKNVTRDGILKRLVNTTPGYAWLLEHSHLLQLARNASVRSKSAARSKSRENPTRETVLLPQSSVPTAPSEATELGRALFRRLKKLADDRTIPLLVVTTGFHPISSPQDREPTKAFMATAAQGFSEDEIVFYDCSNDLRRKLSNSYSSIRIAGDGHPNEAGAKAIADANWTAIQEYLAAVSKVSD